MNRKTALTASNAESSKDNSQRYLNLGRYVFQTAADSLLELKDVLDNKFLHALDLLFNTNGRIIVSGMGKSGHIASKIAATLASTGTPAFFVHPSEASHGDLGMIAKNDLVLALSNSGETIELTDIITHAKRFKVPFIVVTSKKDSYLAKAADVSLIIPNAEEACPYGLAPTTSTTTMLALGDAIAVALLERRKFSPEDFHMLHPGGKLGRRLLKVSDIMHTSKEIPTVPLNMKMSEAIIVMTAKHFGCVGVINEAGLLIGVITDGDLRRHMGEKLLEKQAGDIMTSPFKTITPDALASEGLTLMNDHSITNLFVTTDQRPVGILHIHDCLRSGIA